MILKKNLKTYFKKIQAYTAYGSNDIYHYNTHSIRRLGYKVTKFLCVYSYKCAWDCTIDQ